MVVFGAVRCPELLRRLQMTNLAPLGWWGNIWRWFLGGLFWPRQVPSSSLYRLTKDWVGELGKFSPTGCAAVKRCTVVRDRDSNVRLVIGPVSLIGSGMTNVMPRALGWKAGAAETPCAAIGSALAWLAAISGRAVLNVAGLVTHSRKTGRLGLANTQASHRGQCHYRSALPTPVRSRT